MNSSPMRFIRQDVLSMHAYAVQASAGMVKLDAMENPYTLSPALQQALGERLGAVAINRYPGARVELLKQKLADHVQLPTGCALMLGNGSDELISLLSIVCAVPGAKVMAPEPGFVMYAMSAKLQGLPFVGVPLLPNFELDEPAMVSAIEAHQPAILYLAYPNNPTANLWDGAVIQRLIAQVSAYGGLVVMDEAYQPFSSGTWLDNMRRDPVANSHVLLMRTLSKFGLAGVRLGYMLGPQALLHEVDKLRPPYNVSVLNAECALFALEHAHVFAQQAQDIRAERERLLARLQAWPGITPFASQANMLLARFAGGNEQARTIFEGLKHLRILVKNVTSLHPLLHGCLRLTVGTPAENDALLQALQTLLPPTS